MAPRVACVHEWLTEWGGSEDVTRALLDCLPGASLYATIDFLSEADRKRMGVPAIHTTFLQRAPFVRARFWNYLPLTAMAVESHDLRQAQMIVSSSHAFAKGVITTAEQLHLSYVHSPMRWAWDLHHQYMEDYGLRRGPKALLARWIFHRARIWDRQTANNVDLFLANSRHVRDRVWRAYRRPAQVVYPPVAIDRFDASQPREDFYVTVSRLVSYKRVDLMLEAFRAMPGRRLVVIGDGPEAERLAHRCPPNVELMGWQPGDVVASWLARARAFVFAAHEDFGISPVEAQAAGAPVIAYGVGGALETVVAAGAERPPTGVFFHQQTPAALIDAVERFEEQANQFHALHCRAWAETFGPARFAREFQQVVGRAWEQWQLDPRRVEEAVLGHA